MALELRDVPSSCRSSGSCPGSCRSSALDCALARVKAPVRSSGSCPSSHRSTRSRRRSHRRSGKPRIHLGCWMTAFLRFVTLDDGEEMVPFTNVVYIERTDFRLKDSKDYYGFAPGKTVLLRYAFPIKCTEVIYGNDSESIAEIRAEYDPLKKTKPKGVLHWVAQAYPGVEPLKVEVRIFEKLFLSENPAELENWLADLNPASKEVVSEAYAVPSLAGAVVGDRFQFERLGYFAVDPDSTTDKLVFNRVVTLRDTYSKGGNK